jgi:lipopolysaccharide export LptBFGC system permease protein LptF
MEKLEKKLNDSAQKEKRRVSRLSLDKGGAKVGSNESNQASATLQAALTRARARNNYVDIVSQAKSLEDRKFKITKSGQIDKRFKGNRTANVIAKNAQKEGLPSLNMMATGNITQRRKNRYNPLK